jgi:hypothetical protein
MSNVKTVNAGAKYVREVPDVHYQVNSVSTGALDVRLFIVLYCWTCT